jgi:hypothetical protein
MSYNTTLGYLRPEPRERLKIPRLGGFPRASGIVDPDTISREFVSDVRDRDPFFPIGTFSPPFCLTDVLALSAALIYHCNALCTLSPWLIYTVLQDVGATLLSLT